MGEAIAVLGAGSWGTALAVHLAGKGIPVRLWTRDLHEVMAIRLSRTNQRYLPGVAIPDCVELSSDLETTLEGARVVVLSIPSQSVREVIRQVRPYLKEEQILINTAKGLERNSCLRMSQVIGEELPGCAGRLAVLSGPSHAEEVGRNLPTAVVVAAQSPLIANEVQDLFMSPNFRVYTNSDLVGVELGGSLKNIIALGAGISEGLGFGDNTKAAIITRGLTEIVRLGVALGASPFTFLGLTGVGDLVVTGTSMHSRNRRAGIMLGQGLSLDETIAQVGMVVEGVETTRVARILARRYQIEMPITEQTGQVLFEGLAPRTAVTHLMLREKRHEVEEVFINSFT